MLTYKKINYSFEHGTKNGTCETNNKMIDSNVNVVLNTIVQLFTNFESFIYTVVIIFRFITQLK